MDFDVNVTDLDQLSRDFKAAVPAVRKQYRKGLKDAAKAVAEDAKERIAEKSPETAAAIKVGTRGVNRVVITAGKRRISSLLEGDGYPGTWRHPLFGDRNHWYDEDRHPYLWPAWKANQEEASAKLAEVIRDGLHEADIDSEVS